MPNKNISLLSRIVLPVTVILSTVCIFLLFGDQADDDRLYYTNTALTVWLETVFFGYRGAWRLDKRAVTAPFLAALGVGAFYYVGAALLWMLCYSLMLKTFVSFSVYCVIHLTVLLAWLTVFTLMAELDNKYKENAAQQAQHTHALNFYTQRMKACTSRFRNALAEKSQATVCPTHTLDALTRHIETLPPSVLNTPQGQNILTDIVVRCEEQIEELETAQHEETVTGSCKKIERFVKNTLIELDMLRATAKR